MFAYVVVHVTNYSVSKGAVFDAYLEMSLENFLDFCNENSISYTMLLCIDFPSVNIRDHVDNYVFSVKVESYGM